MSPSPKISVDTEPPHNSEKDVGGARNGVEFGPTERARLLRKLDWHLLPLVTLLFLLSFLDRANVGNAKIAGMSTDLNLVGFRYNIAAAVFFVRIIPPSSLQHRMTTLAF
ncbi:hypothetical protein PAXINDRAFT_13119 [Paxillus involutus ATCC 200175]|uniref:Major facilitator superfamily (MFS) profile domain-containing protein n=1 Tax=Paxillus involutus ATCC 200175 TaxID=664439 RepID=A0A0C9U3Z5_PAXIN|nr:hypothetical protein PAXINDRAFT_13119 [Paxillus involutus ATCC 200175]